LLEVPLPMVEVWEELQAQVEPLTGQADLRIIGTILENEVTRRVGPPHRPDAASGAGAQQCCAPTTSRVGAGGEGFLG